MFGSSGPAEFEWAGRDETKAGDKLWFMREEDVGCELLADKVIPRNIGIEAIDHVIPKSPSVRAFTVVLTTV